MNDEDETPVKTQRHRGATEFFILGSLVDVLTLGVSEEYLHRHVHSELIHADRRAFGLEA